MLSEAELAKRREENALASAEAEKVARERIEEDQRNGVLSPVHSLANSVKEKLEAGDVRPSLETHITRDPEKSIEPSEDAAAQ